MEECSEEILAQSKIDKLVANLSSLGLSDSNSDHELSKLSYPRGSSEFFQNNNVVFDIINNAELDKLYSYIIDFPEGVAKARTAFGDTPLHYAVRDSNPTAIRLKIIKILLSHGGDVLAKDDAGMTPVHIAANTPYAFEALELLLAHAVDKFGRGNNDNFKGYADLSEILRIPDNNGLTALHYALRSGRLESIELLILHNAPLDCRESSQNATPLLWCFRNTNMTVESIETVFMLVAGFSDFVDLYGIIKLDLDAVDAGGDTLLHYACTLGAHNIVQALLYFGASINNIPVSEGGKPYSINKKNEERFKIIRGYLQNPDSAKKTGRPLQLYEYKLKHFYLNTVVNNLDEVLFSDSNDNNMDASANTSQLKNSQVPRMVGQLKTIPHVPVDLDYLCNRLSVILCQLPDMSAQFLEALKYLETNAPDLFKQHRCLNYRNFYECVYKLPESSAFINNILTIPAIRVGMDLKYSFLTMTQFSKSFEKLNTLISRCSTQIVVLSEKETERNVGKMSKDQLEAVFPNHDVAVIKAIYKDKPTLKTYVDGLRRKSAEYAAEKENLTRVNLIFSTVQKFIHIVEYVQQIFILGSQTQSTPQVLQRLKNMVDQACNKTVNAAQDSVISSSREIGNGKGM